MRGDWKRTTAFVIAAASLVGFLACVGSDPDPVTPTPDAARPGDDDDDDRHADSGVVPGNDSAAPFGCSIGTEKFDFCDSFDGPSFVPPWDSVSVTDAGHLERADGGATGIIDIELPDASSVLHPTGAATVKKFLGDIGVFVLERRVRVTPTAGTAGQDTDPGVVLAQVVFTAAAGGSGASFVFFHGWAKPSDAGTFDFRDAYLGLGLSLGGTQQSDRWKKLPSAGQWYLVRDTYELTDTTVTFTVTVDGAEQVHTTRSMAVPHMQSAVLFNGPSTFLDPKGHGHASWVVDIDDVRVGIKPR